MPPRPLLLPQQSQLVQETLAHILQLSHRMADLTGCYLRELTARIRAEFPDSPIPENPGWPTEFCLEIAAILQLRQWELAGLSPSLSEPVPTAASLLDDLWNCIERDATAYIQGTSGTDLNQRVLRLWVQHFSPHSLNHLRVDIVVASAQPADGLLETLADLLWKYRDLNEGRPTDAET